MFVHSVVVLFDSIQNFIVLVNDGLLSENFTTLVKTGHRLRNTMEKTDFVERVKLVWQVPAHESYAHMKGRLLPCVG